MNEKDRPIPTPLPAATVILVREKNDQLQVYLLKRSTKSGFMAGNYVFPGGVVDPADQEIALWLKQIDLDTKRLAHQLGKGLLAEEILPYAVAAVRETLEEAGIFFAQKTGRSTTDLERICALRDQHTSDRDWFKKQVVAEGWTLAVSQLSCWSHWITPRRMKKRFDTRFFIAQIPQGQKCVPDGRETTYGLWITPYKALIKNQTGQIPLSPPTLVTLHGLLGYASLVELKTEIAHRKWGKAIFPRLVTCSEGAVIVEPWDPLYDRNPIELDLDDLKKNLRQPGEPFSRIWYSGGVCRPVGSPGCLEK